MTVFLTLSLVWTVAALGLSFSRLLDGGFEPLVAFSSAGDARPGVDPGTIPASWCQHPGGFDENRAAHGVFLFQREGKAVEQREWRHGRAHGYWRSWNGSITHHVAAFRNGALAAGHWPVAEELTPPTPDDVATMNPLAHLVPARLTTKYCEWGRARAF